MELMTKLIVNPLLWMVYITLPLLNEALLSPRLLPWDRWSLETTFLCLFTLVYECYIYVQLLSTFLVGPWPGLVTSLAFIGTFWGYTYFLKRTFLRGLLLQRIRNFCLLPLPDQPFRILWLLPLPGQPFRILWLLPLSGLGIFAWAKATTHFFIFGLKNRKACQLLSALAAMVTGFTKARIFAAIPVSFGMILTIPDLDPDPWMKFKVRFAEFLTAHMDEESLQALLCSTFFKMLGCNEMKPSLPGHIQSSARAWFMRDGSTSQHKIFNDSNVELDELIDKGTSSQQEIFYDANVELEYIEEETSSQHGIFYDSIVEPKYKIGWGSITTLVRQDQIDVGVFTPFSGVKSMTIKNTPRSRYNLDKSARFWRENPETGIWNKEKHLAMDPAEVEIYCVSVDDWIKLCGSDDYIFEELVSDQIL